MTETVTGLALLRLPFPDHQISKLPKGTKAQNECQASEKTNCKICGGWHHPRIIHLDYVGHAALTYRLLDVDPGWSWEPLAFDDRGLPALDESGGLWIRLTVLGVTRLGYGDAGTKKGGDAMKERIGDALRNAAMRGGAGLELWHKGDLRGDDAAPKMPEKEIAALVANIESAATVGELRTRVAEAGAACTAAGDDDALAAVMEAAEKKFSKARASTTEQAK